MIFNRKSKRDNFYDQLGFKYNNKYLLKNQTAKGDIVSKQLKYPFELSANLCAVINMQLEKVIEPKIEKHER